VTEKSGLGQKSLTLGIPSHHHTFPMHYNTVVTRFLIFHRRVRGERREKIKKTQRSRRLGGKILLFRGELRNN
jgi:hypothetical protein